MNDVDDDVDEMHMEGEATVATHDVSGTTTSEQSSAMLSSVNAYVLFVLVLLLQIGGFLVLFMRTRSIHMLKTIASSIQQTTSSIQQTTSSIQQTTSSIQQTTSSIEKKLDFSVAETNTTTTRIEAAKSFSTGGVLRVTSSI
jgi:hypothetical protein